MHKFGAKIHTGWTELDQQAMYYPVGNMPRLQPDGLFRRRRPCVFRESNSRATMGIPEKHSLTLSRHRTSVTLEPAFWHAFRAIAAERGLTLNALAVEIDLSRGADQGLASAIRVFCLMHYHKQYLERHCPACRQIGGCDEDCAQPEGAGVLGAVSPWRRSPG